MRSSFEYFLEHEKQISPKGINSRISRLNWVEEKCRMSANQMVQTVEQMFDCRKEIYTKEQDKHKAGNYYNALKLYYEYINGEPCPRINSKKQ